MIQYDSAPIYIIARELCSRDKNADYSIDERSRSKKIGFLLSTSGGSAYGEFPRGYPGGLRRLGRRIWTAYSPVVREIVKGASYTSQE